MCAALAEGLQSSSLESTLLRLTSRLDEVSRDCFTLSRRSSPRRRLAVSTTSFLRVARCRFLETHVVLAVLVQMSRIQGSGINMQLTGRWVFAALAGVCLCVSCTEASTGGGTNWINDPSSKLFPGRGLYHGRERYETWQNVTALLQEAKNNGTFPGTSVGFINMRSRCV